MTPPARPPWHNLNEVVRSNRIIIAAMNANGRSPFTFPFTFRPDHPGPERRVERPRTPTAPASCSCSYRVLKQLHELQRSKKVYKSLVSKQQTALDFTR